MANTTALEWLRRLLGSTTGQNPDVLPANQRWQLERDTGQTNLTFDQWMQQKLQQQLLQQAQGNNQGNPQTGMPPNPNLTLNGIGQGGLRGQ